MNKKLFSKNLDLIVFRGLKKYSQKNKLGIYISILILVVSFLITKLPYFNIAMNPELMWPVVVSVVAYVSNISKRSILIIIIILFSFCPLLTFVGDGFGAEYFSNVIFFLILCLLIKSFIDYKSNYSIKKGKNK